MKSYFEDISGDRLVHVIKLLIIPLIPQKCMTMLIKNKTAVTAFLILALYIKSNHNVSCNKSNALLTTWAT